MGCGCTTMCCASTPEAPPPHMVATWVGFYTSDGRVQVHMIIDSAGYMELTRTPREGSSTGFTCNPVAIQNRMRYNHCRFPLAGWNQELPTLGSDGQWVNVNLVSLVKGKNYSVYPFTRKWKMMYSPKGISNDCKECITIWLPYEGAAVALDLHRTAGTSTENNPLPAAVAAVTEEA